ncbi:MAG: hypothetical protein NC314_11790 [Roseburia sp.]|nr:hypothetical protein [Ruminococcus sp.]MCM1155721.1 hypothetical protein [Roseburia sp.]MCM1243513.1 hypothetical protein [Roseburia sp.]
MQSLLVSSHQALNGMEIIDDTQFYNSDKVRAYLKTRKGIHFKELDKTGKIDAFLLGLMNYVLGEIAERT